MSDKFLARSGELSCGGVRQCVINAIENGTIYDLIMNNTFEHVDYLRTFCIFSKISGLSGIEVLRCNGVDVIVINHPDQPLIIEGGDIILGDKSIPFCRPHCGGVMCDVCNMVVKDCFFKKAKSAHKN